MSTTKIESLELEITGNAGSAESSLSKLAETLGKLRDATKGGLGLTSVAKQLKAVSDSAKGIDTNAAKNVEGIAKAISLLSGVKISSSIGNQLTSINSAINGLNLGSGASKIQELLSVLEPLKNLPKTNLSSFVTPLKKLPEVLADLNKLDMGAFAAKMQEVANAVKPLADEMYKVAQGFSAFPSKIQKLITSTNQLSTSNTKAAGTYVDLYAKMKTAYAGIKRIASLIASAISKINDYIENVNLFTVSMGEYAEEAGEYAKKVGDLMGIDPGEWMRNQGVFMTLATGFGVAGDRAYVMSQQLTQLGYDISSFFNISYADAMQKLQSGISGELEPLRRLGYDLSQAKLEATALSLGINKAVSSMTQAEKAELRYYAIMTQVTNSHGDMARTLDAPANQIRIFTSQLTQCARAIGSIFIPMLNKVLPYVTAFVKVIRILAENIANLFGFTLPEIDWNSGENATNNIEKNLDGANDAAKRLKNATMGFDELNILSAGNDSDEDTLGTGFEFELPTYDFLEGLTESKINVIVEEMKEWLGLTDDINSWSELFDTRLGSILKTVGLIGVGIAAWKVTKGIIDTIGALKVLLSTPSYTIAIGVILTIVGLSTLFDGLKDAIENGLDSFNFGEIIGGSLLTAGGAAALGSMIVTWIGKVGSTKLVFALAEMGKNLGITTAGGLGAALAAGIVGIIAGIPTYFVGIYDACKNGLDWLSGVLIPAGATAAGAGIGVIIGALGGPIGAGIGALIGLAVGAVTDLVIWIVQEWDTIGQFFVDLWEGIKNVWDKVATWFDTYVIQPVVKFFKGLWENVSGFFINLWEDVKGVWNTVSAWFDTWVIQPLISFFSGLWLRISQFAEGCWLIIRAVWEIVSTWFDENLIQPVVKFFKGLWETVSEFFSNLWTDIKAIWETVSAWFDTWVIQPVVGFFEGLWINVSGFFSSLWTDVKAVWGTVSTWFDETVISPVKDAFELACDKISEFFSELWRGLKNGVAVAMNAVIGTIEWLLNKVISGINTLIGGFNKIVQWAADVLGEDWGGMSLVKEVELGRITIEEEPSKNTPNLRKYNTYFSRYAEGGFPEQGQMFIAREAGAELVGSIGRRTAVVNNEQIVESVSNGVAVANEEQNALLREQNTLLRAILQKDTGVTLDGKTLTKSVEKYQRERGATIYTGGVLNGV
jgi:hypothetical protein